jgi:carbonic anhydrase
MTDQTRPPRALATTPADARRLLAEGNARYVANEPQPRDYAAERASRAMGQAPFATILSCADSRVAPELAFDQGPGQLFVVRLAGNVVTTEVLASIEFGAAVLGTPLVLVLGHTRCGAVQATLASLREGTEHPGHLGALVEAIAPAVAPVLDEPGDPEANAVRANVRQAVERLRAAPPILADLVRAGSLDVVGGVYDLSTGRAELLST